MENQLKKPAGRLLDEFMPLKLAEQKLLDACRIGEFAIISEQRPQQANEQNIVRASFLRFLALGGDGCAPVHEKGVLLHGAWVEDELNLEGALLPHNLALDNCHLSTIILLHSDVHGCVGFKGCRVEGLAADGMMCSGGVFLKNFTATGTVNLLNAQIGGNLECSGGKFNGNGGDALVCDRALIKGSVFLNDGFIASGTVLLVAARIDGSLECKGAVFNDTRSGKEHVAALVCDRAVIKGRVVLKKAIVNGTVRLSGAQIGDNLECKDATFNSTNDYAFQAESMTVAGAFNFRGLRSVDGIVSLSSAKVGRLIDDVDSWTNVELILDGFVYNGLTDNAPTDAKSRLAWLDKQRPSHAGLAGDGKDFKPQPWQQLQKVLREMGHVEDARQVAIAFEKRLRHANLIGQTPKSWNKSIAWMYRKVSRSFHRLFGCLIGYGYRPFGLFVKVLFVWLACGMFYWVAAYNGVFAPSNPLVFQNFHYAACVPDSKVANAEKVKAELAKTACLEPPPIQGAGNWYLCEKLREEYTGFSPLAYSLDLILPLVDLQQERDWAPMIPTPKNSWIAELSELSLKHVTRLVLWFEILFGWLASLLLVAVVSGLTKRREE